MRPQSQGNKQRVVPRLEEKLEVLDCLQDGMSICAVAHKFGRNESSIVAASTPTTAKVPRYVQDEAMGKAHEALNLWLEDMTLQRIPIDALLIYPACCGLQ
uniref:HTH psq-type domain-containing protein n=1 Tax=Podarcis muralis TaxID=64176 RepID=A0A670KEN1_PODMU